MRCRPNLDGLSNRPSKRRHLAETLADEEASEPEKAYVYFPKCSWCQDRGSVCKAVKDKQGERCIPCKLAGLSCSAIQGGNIVGKQSDTLTLESLATEKPITKSIHSQRVGSTGSPLKRQRLDSTSSSNGEEDSSEIERSFSVTEAQQAKAIEICGQRKVYSLAFQADGNYFVSAGSGGTIRCWQVEDRKEVPMPLNAGQTIRDMAVSQDGKCIVTTSGTGKVRVWNAETYEQAIKLDGRAWEMDISPDATKIVLGGDDVEAISVWSLSTGQRLLGPLGLYVDLAAIKFSPDGRLFAAAARSDKSIRIFDSQSGQLLFNFPVSVSSDVGKQSIVWMTDSKHLFALSNDGDIHCLNVYSRETRATWIIHSKSDPTCIVLSSDGTFIAASAGPSVSFWDTKTYKQIGSVIHHTARVTCMAMSSNYDLVIGGKGMALWDLCDILPPPYSDEVLKVRRKRAHAKTVETVHVHGEKTLHFEKTMEQVCAHFVNSQIAAKQMKDDLDDTIRSLSMDLHPLNDCSTNLENVVQELVHFQLKTNNLVQKLHTEFSDARRKADDFIYLNQQKHHCENLYIEGRIICAAQRLLEMMRTGSGDVIADWLPGFKNKCLVQLERIGDEASATNKDDEAVDALFTALSLDPSAPHGLLTKWVRSMLLRRSINDVLDAAIELRLPKSDIQHAICDGFEEGGRITEAISYFHQVKGELSEDAEVPNGQSPWEVDFQQRCVKKLEKLANDAADSENYQEAAENLSTILSLDGVDREDALAKRCRAWMKMKSWKDALKDAHEAIELHKSASHQGPEGKERSDVQLTQAFETILQAMNPE